MNDRMRVVDLFAGAGGLSLGFQEAGAEIVYALEEDKWAAESYTHNFPAVQLDVCDIRKVSKSKVSRLRRLAPDVVIGGPPCQGFSHSNTLHKDPKDPRNSLLVDYLRFVEQLQPEICLIENVKGLLNTRNELGERVIDIVSRVLEDLNYKVSWRILNAADFGVPQIRERLFIVASRDGSSADFRWPDHTHSEPLDGAPTLFPDSARRPWVTLEEAIADLPQIVHGEEDLGDRYSITPRTAYQKLMRRGSPRKIENHEPMRHTQRIVERFSQIGFGESEGDVESHLRPHRRGDPGVLSGRAYGQNSRRQRPDRPCNTVVASSHTNFIHPHLNRNFTVREMARVQSFPDWFVFRGKRAVLSKKLSLKKGLMDDIYLDQRMQVGNAVAPLEARALAIELMRVLGMEGS